MFKRPSDGYPIPTIPHPNEEKEIGRTSLPKSFKHYLYNYTSTGMHLTKQKYRSIEENFDEHFGKTFTHKKFTT